jgi:hypothetical protein
MYKYCFQWQTFKHTSWTKQSNGTKFLMVPQWNNLITCPGLMTIIPIPPTKKLSELVQDVLAKLHTMFIILTNHHCNCHGSVCLGTKCVAFRRLAASPIQTTHINTFTPVEDQASHLIFTVKNEGSIWIGVWYIYIWMLLNILSFSKSRFL